MEKFTNLYSIQKTLRFALKPQGKTAENIKSGKLLQKDEDLAIKYKDAKKIIDEYHKYFINDRLSDFSFEKGDLDDFKSAYDEALTDKNDVTKKKELTKLQNSLRKKISQQLKNDRLFKKEFIKEDLPQWLNGNEIKSISDPRSIIKDFNKWTSYFAGFNKNRKNIYTKEPHSTAIGFRLIHENLPRFLKNTVRYEKAKKLEIDFSKIEENFEVTLDEVFTLDYFNKCLIQEGIDHYNLIIGGQNLDNNEKIQGINEVINLHVQQLDSQISKAPDADEDKKELQSKRKEARSCKMEVLYKQILSDRSQLSFRLKNISNDAQLCQEMQNIFSIDENKNIIGKQEIVDKNTGEIKDESLNISEHLNLAVEALENADPSQIYIKNDKSMTDISQFLFGDWSVISKSLYCYAENEKLGKNKQGEAKKFTQKEKNDWIKKTAYFSFAEIHSALENYFEQYKDDELEDNKESEEGITKENKELALNQPLYNYFKKLTVKKKNSNTNADDKVRLLDEITSHYKDAHSVLDNYKDEEREVLKGEKKSVEKIKNYLDALMGLLHFLKPLYIELKNKDEKQANAFIKDNSFYHDFDTAYEALKAIIPLYNQTRNYLTKKLYSVEKYKLNFENVSLAAGWDKNKETANSCVLLLKDKRYFLAVMNKKHNQLFAEENLDLIKINERLENNHKELQKKEEELSGKREGTRIYEQLNDKIKSIRRNLEKDEKIKNILFNKKNVYKKILYKQVADAKKDIINLVMINDEAKRYTKNLDEIRGKNCPNIQKIKENDSYKGKDINITDLQTFIDYYKECAIKYWNWCDFDFKDTKEYGDFKEFTEDINRQGYKIKFQEISAEYIEHCVEDGKLYLFEIYSKDFSPHSKGKPSLQTLYWKNLFSKENLADVVYKLNGEAEFFFRKASLTYDDNIWKQGHHANDSSKKQKYPIIKDRRYAQDTYLFHVPITCNFKAQGISKFNDKVNGFLKNNENINILGIDRGERHLAYYTVINQKGEIIKDKDGNYLQGSLNNPQGNKDYHELLDKREKDRDQARKSWGTIGKIKDLKEGYLSQVVHKICKIMVENNAIVVFEDLNFGFKKGRFKVEKQVYQKLEKMLIDKLSYLVFKDKQATEPGGVLNGLQLTAPFQSFSKMGKQTGFIFYVPAYHTSKVCPATGFVNLLYPRYETIKKSQEFFKKFDGIKYNSSEDYFEFSFVYKKFTDKAVGSRQDWTLCSHSIRLENYRNRDNNNQWDVKEVHLTNELIKLFDSENISYRGGENIALDIANKHSSQFHKELIRLLKLTLQMRNSKIGIDEDWLISPVQDKQGKFFDSRFIIDDSMPKDADANGAYHIALKGLWAIREINQLEDGNKLDLAISNKKWYQFAQGMAIDRKEC